MGKSKVGLMTLCNDIRIYPTDEFENSIRTKLVHSYLYNDVGLLLTAPSTTMRNGMCDAQAQAQSHWGCVIQKQSAESWSGTVIHGLTVHHGSTVHLCLSSSSPCTASFTVIIFASNNSRYKDHSIKIWCFWVSSLEL